MNFCSNAPCSGGESLTLDTSPCNLPMPRIHCPFGRLIVILILIIVLASCSTVSKTEDEKSSDSLVAENPTSAQAAAESVEGDTTTLPEDYVPEHMIPPDEVYDAEADTLFDEQLSKFFSEEQILKLKQSLAAFHDISDASSLAAYYIHTIPQVCEIINKQIAEHTPTMSGDNSPEATWSWLLDYYPGIYLSVDCGECEYSAKNEISPLIELAKKTEGDEDDVFLDLAATVYGGTIYNRTGLISNSGGWYTLEGCHFCNASTLGDGKRIEIIRKLETASSSRRLFESEMDQFLTAVLQVKDDRYLYSKQKVLTEIDQVLASKILSDKQRIELTNERDNVSNYSEFDCGKEGNKCTWPEF